MIRRNTVTQTYQLCMGEYADLRAGFVSDTILTDKVLKFNPGLYTISGEPNGTAFQIKYPGGPGTYEMAIVSCKNYKAYLIVISPYRFQIEYHFFVSKDISGWLPNTTFALYNALDGNGFASSLGFFIQVHDEIVVAEIPVEVQGFCQIDTEFLHDGFIPNKDCKITIEVPNLSVTNNFYAALIKDNLINQSDNIVPGLILSYAQISNGSTNFRDIPNLFSASSKGFVNLANKATADVVIQGSSLQANGQYRLYIVYYTSGGWRSCISEPIRQKTSRSPVVPSVETAISDDSGNSINTSCGKGMANSRAYSLSATIDITDYNSKLSAEGHTGTYGDYFVSAIAFISKTTNGNSGVNIPLSGNHSSGVFEIADFVTNSPSAFVIIQVRMKIDGIDDLINIVFDLTYSARKTPFLYRVLDSEGFVEELCDVEDYIGNTTWSECELYQSIDGGPFVPNTIINGLDIDLSNMPFDAKVCFQAVCDLGATADPNCGSEKFAIRTVKESCISVFGNTLCTPTYFFDFFNFDPGTWVAEMTPVFNDIPNIVTPQLTGDNYNDTWDIDPQLIQYITSLKFIINSDGCEYIIEDALPYLNTPAQPSISIPVSSDCDCPEELLCNNYAAFETTCDRDTHEVTISLFKNINSPIDTEQELCSLDGGITYIPLPASVIGEANIFLRYTATFTDGCEPVNIEQVITCQKYLEVLDERFIELEIDGNGFLNIDITSEFGNTPLEDLLYVSLDGGLNFITYDLLGDGYEPIQLTGGENIVVRSRTVFDAKTEDLIARGIIPNPIQLQNCPGYGDYTLMVNFDEDTSTFEVVKTGDESQLIKNEILWTLNGGDPINGGGIPYFGPFVGEGLFVAAWLIQLENCAQKIIHSARFGKGCVKICNFDELEFNTEPTEVIVNVEAPQVTVNVDACCDEEKNPCPDLILEITCINKTLTLTGFVSGSTITWAGPDGFTGSGEIVMFPSNTSSGVFTATIDNGECTDTATYNYTKPNAGEAISNPIIIQ